MHRLFVAFLAALPAIGCSCFSNASPCSALESTAVVFVAQVVVDSGEGIGTGPAKVTIVEPLQNVPKAGRSVWSDPSKRALADTRMTVLSRTSPWN